jgi:hypothetical protein
MTNDKSDTKEDEPKSFEYYEKSGILIGDIYYMYFYRLEPQGSRYRVTLYVYEDGNPIDENRRDRIIEKLARNAHIEDVYPPICGWDFGDLKWRRKSYFVVLLDDRNDRFQDHNGIHFITRNYSFADGGDLPSVDIGGNETRSAIWCINHMAGPDQCNIPEGPDDYVFEFRSVQHPGGFTSKPNMGPVVPPPAYM